MNEITAKRLLDLVLWITENYWGYNLLDICDDIVENNKLTPKELVNCLSPEAYAQLMNKLKEKYLNQPYLKKLITHYETFLNENKKGRGTSSTLL